MTAEKIFVKTNIRTFYGNMSVHVSTYQFLLKLDNNNGYRTVKPK